MGLLELRKKEGVLGYISVGTAIPRSPKIRAFTKSTIRSTMPMAMALSQPQSKKYFIRAIQMNNTISCNKAHDEDSKQISDDCSQD